MAYPEFHYRWDYDLRASPAALWPLVSDTNRFNRDGGVPPVSRRGGPSLPNARQRLRLVRFGVPIEWEEEPFEWVRPYGFGVKRRYSSGPVAEMTVRAQIQARADGGSHVIYEVSARPRNALGLVAIPAQIGIIGARSFRNIFRRYDRIALSGERTPVKGENHLTSAGRARLAQIREALAADGARSDLVARLATTVDQGDDITVARMRPYALAEAWGASRREVLELCLLATRLGLLELRWDVLCPLCRGAKESFSTLSALGSRVHCDVCNIDASVNLDRFVEVTFRPNRAIRDADVGEYCVGGPQVTPHVLAQQLLRSGEQRTLQLPLEAGRHRLRSLPLPGAQPLTARDGGDAAHSVTLTDAGWPDDEPLLAINPSLTLLNQTGAEQLVILERMAWSDEAATAADVIVLQRFRDLFAREALRPEQPISVGSLAIAFTDLRGSTRLYRNIGDAPAFGVVMDHFDVLHDVVAEHGGTVVKTIGDAVMAAFLHPSDAVRAMLAAQEALASRQSEREPVSLKAGVHYGPCIAVTLNERLDYFGSSVNIAARLEGLSTGRDVIVSGAVRQDSDVEHFLSHSEGIVVEPVQATLKGLEEEEIIIWRIQAEPSQHRGRGPGAAAMAEGAPSQ